MSNKVNMEMDIKDIDIKLLDEPGPEDDLISGILLALYHLGKKSKDPKGFWIRAGQVLQWLKANGLEVDTTPSIGRIIRNDLRFQSSKRMADGQFTWIPRSKLSGHIEKFNDGNVDVQVSGTHYEAVKRDVFQTYIDCEDVDELDHDAMLIDKATKEYLAMNDKQRKEWLECGE